MSMYTLKAILQTNTDFEATHLLAQKCRPDLKVSDITKGSFTIRPRAGKAWTIQVGCRGGVNLWVEEGVDTRATGRLVRHLLQPTPGEPLKLTLKILKPTPKLAEYMTYCLWLTRLLPKANSWAEWLSETLDQDVELIRDLATGLNL